MQKNNSLENLLELPPNLPLPVDDGACKHLVDMCLPSIFLQSNTGVEVDLSKEKGQVVLYIFPMIARPGGSPLLNWDEIPGARGCTPQSCAFRDIYHEFQALQTKVYGLSAQSYVDQVEAAKRLYLPFNLLNDAQLNFASLLALPTFTYNGVTLIKRITLIVKDGQIKKVFYPIFPPNRNASEVLKWLHAQSQYLV